MYCVPCEDKIRHSREEVERRELFLQDLLSLGLPMEGLFTLGLPATLIFFFPHSAAVVIWRVLRLLPQC